MSENDEIKTSPGAIGGTRYSHPAMVMVGFSRCSGNMSLFGSSVKCQNYIALRIARANVTRDLSHDWYNTDGQDMIEVYLSPIQFAELLTSMNVGSGVPATLAHFNGENFSMPKMAAKQEVFKEEIAKDVKDALDRLEEVSAEITRQLDSGKPMTKATMKKLLSDVEGYKRLVTDHLPYTLEAFSREMDRTVVEAKAAVDAFVQHTVSDLGLEALRGKVALEIGEEKSDG